MLPSAFPYLNRSGTGLSASTTGLHQRWANLTLSRRSKLQYPHRPPAIISFMSRRPRLDGNLFRCRRRTVRRAVKKRPAHIRFERQVSISHVDLLVVDRPGVFLRGFGLAKVLPSVASLLVPASNSLRHSSKLGVALVCMGAGSLSLWFATWTGVPKPAKNRVPKVWQ
jgi:hypothetical protein